MIIIDYSQIAIAAKQLIDAIAHLRVVKRPPRQLQKLQELVIKPKGASGESV